MLLFFLQFYEAVTKGLQEKQHMGTNSSVLKIVLKIVRAFFLRVVMISFQFMFLFSDCVESISGPGTDHSKPT